MKIQDYHNFRGIKGGLFTFLVIGAVNWIPILSRHLISDVKNNISDVIFIIYIVIAISLFLFIGYRLISNKVTTNALIVGICVTSMILLNVVLFYLYSYKILVSKASLFITIPISLLVAIVCAEVWIKISDKIKNK